MQLLTPGSTFGEKYEVVRTLSSGGMGVVYEVLHRDTQRRRAVKVMLPQLLTNEDMRQRFQREGLVTAGIESEHLVEVFDVGVDPASQAPYIVMELLRGEDLGARLGRGEQTAPREVVALLDQIVRGLERTHAAGIVHRDLKPENLFVTHRDDGTHRVKILDFGIAKLVDNVSKATSAIGTPLYMAPEQMTGESKRIGPAADLYSLAQIVFTLLVGRPYFQREADTADNPLAFMFRTASGTVDPASDRARELGVVLPPNFDLWFAKAANLDPAQRFASATSMLAALREVLADVNDLTASASRRRAVAFQPTHPVATGSVIAASQPVQSASSSAEPDHEPEPPSEVEPQHEATAKSAAILLKPRGLVVSGTGPIPSSRTIDLAPREAERPKSRALWWGVGATVLLVAGGFTLSRSWSDSAKSPEPEQAAQASASASVATSSPAPPKVTMDDLQTSSQISSETAAAPSTSSAAPDTSSAVAVASSSSPTAAPPQKTSPKSSTGLLPKTPVSAVVPPLVGGTVTAPGTGGGTPTWSGPRR